MIYDYKNYDYDRIYNKYIEIINYFSIDEIETLKNSLQTYIDNIKGEN